jgi:hypothetical protein
MQSGRALSRHTETGNNIWDWEREVRKDFWWERHICWKTELLVQGS